jgi:hypothetical protein
MNNPPTAGRWYFQLLKRTNLKGYLYAQIVQAERSPVNVTIPFVHPA